MPAKRCVETKNMCLLFVDYCNESKKKNAIPAEANRRGYESAKETMIP